MSDTAMGYMQLALTIISGIFAAVTWFFSMKNQNAQRAADKEQQELEASREEAKERKEELRRDDVLAWASSTIKTLRHAWVGMREEIELRRPINITPISSEISSAIEVGRLFFKNTGLNTDWGAEKSPAYAGYRPLILDTLVAAFDCLQKWQTEKTPQKKQELLSIFDKASRDFVSFARNEVGREDTASDYASKPGHSQPFEYYKKSVTLFARGNPKFR